MVVLEGPPTAKRPRSSPVEATQICDKIICQIVDDVQVRSLARAITDAVMSSLVEDASAQTVQVPTDVETLQHRNAYLQTAIHKLHVLWENEKSVLKHENRQLAATLANCQADVLQSNSLVEEVTSKCVSLESHLASEQSSAAELREKVNYLSTENRRLEEAHAGSTTLIEELKVKCDGLENELAVLSRNQNALVPVSNYGDVRHVDVSDTTRDDLRLGQAADVMFQRMNDTLTSLPSGSAMSFLHITKGPSK